MKTKATKPTLLASSPTIEGIIGCINRYWYSGNYTVNPETLAIEHPDPSSATTKCAVRLVKGRYRFETTAY